MKAKKWKPEGRFFDGRFFDIYTYTGSKTKANLIKQSLKKDGYFVRIVREPYEKYKGKYVIFVWVPKHLIGIIPSIIIDKEKYLHNR